MPLYNYQCSSCSEVTELSKKIANRDETSEDACPKCSSIGTLKRQVGSPLVAYSIATAGYGRGAGDGWKEVLKKIDARAPGSRMKETSSFL